MALAQLSDVESAIGRSITDPVEQDQVNHWLTGAEIQIKARLGDVSLLDSDTVIYVEAESVALRMRNPEGYQSETVDDYTYRFGSETRQVTILPDWWALLSPTSAVFSARATFEPDTAANLPVWAELA